MKIKKIRFSAFFLLSMIVTMSGYAQAGNEDTLCRQADPEKVRDLIVYNQLYPFVRYYQNYVEWKNPEAINGFFEKLKNTCNQKVRILHIGDSHLQADVFTGEVRNRMEDFFGPGGRGLIFPYSAAQTHSAYNYRNYSDGEWEYSRNVQRSPHFDLGVTGATIYTNDSAATFSFSFTPGVLKDINRKLKIFLRRSPNSFDLKLIIPETNDTLLIDCDSTDPKPYVEFVIPKSASRFDFYLDKTEAHQYFLELYGVMMENPDNEGVVYMSVGINGATYKSILRQSLMPEHIQGIKPDLVVIDLGSNDFYLGGLNPSSLQSDLIQIIKLIRKYAPESDILISNTHDLYRRSRNITACKTFSEITRKIAFQYDCALYDYYHISGGQYSMMNWLAKNLARRDKIHYSTPGYLFKAELFFNGLMNSYAHFLQQSPDSLQAFVVNDLLKDSTTTKIMKEGVLVQYSKDTLLAMNAKEKLPKVYTYKGSGEELYYKIKSGDNLGAIAEKYGVTVSSLKLWNNLSSSRIVAGETLIIYGNKQRPIVNQDKKPEPYNYKQKNYTISDEKILYRIKSGDNLSYIASKFNVSVEDVQKWNHLQGTKIKSGETLVLYRSVPKTEKKNTHTPDVSFSGNKKYYTIQQGDNLSSIAVKFGVSVHELRVWNNLSGNTIYAGKKLVVYTDGGGQPKQKATNSTVKTKGQIIVPIERNSFGKDVVTYTVNPGDTLWDIAKKYNTSVEKIKQWNGLDTDRIDAGMKLIIKG